MSAKNDRTVALILARAGSKRVPKKNIRLLNGKPLIAYTFEAALASKCFSDIVVSTDDERVKEIAAGSGIAVDERPESMRGDTVRAVEVVEEYLQRTRAGEQYRNVAMMLPSPPNRLVPPTTTAPMASSS